MHFLEMKPFSAVREKYFAEEEFRILQNTLIANPRCAPVIRGTGGVRKLRWSREGMGKRGGVRVIYYYADFADTIAFITAYPKNQKDTLSQSEKHMLRSVIAGLKHNR